MKVIHPNGTEETFMDASISPYISCPNRIGAMCLTEDVVRWWFSKVVNPLVTHYLEIGSFDGVLLSLMAEVFPSTQFYAIDPFAEAGNTGPGHYGYWYINNKNFGNVTLYFSKSEDALPKILATGTKFSAIFIDGDHSYECAKFDIEKSWELLAPGGLMACHDHDMPGVQQACEEFVSVCPYVIECGMPVFYKT